MINRLADLVIGRPKSILGLFALLILVGGAYGRDAAG